MLCWIFAEKMGEKSLYTKKHLDGLLKRSDIFLPEARLGKLYLFHGLIRKYNSEYDLIRTVNFENIVKKHYIDCCYIGRFINFRAPLLDIGSGAGFPGIILKIIFPEKSIILAEKRSKRIDFLNIAIKEVGLENIEVYPHSVNNGSKIECASIITRAVEKIEKTLSRAESLLNNGSMAYFMKGPNVDAEIKEKYGSFMFHKRYDYRIPGTGLQRCLVVYRKCF